MLQGYVGEYELRAGIHSHRHRTAGRRFYAGRQDSPCCEFQAESPTEFFYKAADIQITFVKDPSGAVTHLVLHQDGVDREAKKIK